MLYTSNLYQNNYTRVTIMLMQIRERATGAFAYIIVLLISVPFALWGIQEYFGGPGDAAVAEVNGVEITKQVFDQRLQQQRRYMRSTLGDSFDQLYPDEVSIKKEVIESMVREQLLRDFIQSSGIAISDLFLSQRIQSVPQLQVDGRFSAERYEQVVQSQRMSKAQFENQLRQDEASTQYQSSVVFSSFLTKEAEYEYAALRNQTRSFDYFIASQTIDPQDVKSTAIDNYYQKNQGRFQAPAQVKLDYIEIDQQVIADAMSFSEEQLLETYQQDPQSYRTDELREAKHILFKVPDEASEEQRKAIAELAASALVELKSGIAFATVAQQYSEDTISASNGGDLGFISRMDIDNPVFIDSLFSMKAGQVSPILSTKLGLQIVQLSSVKAPEMVPFEKVRNRIANEVRAQRSAQKFASLADRLQELSYEAENQLESVAEALGLELKSSSWQSAESANGFAAKKKVMDMAFSEEVLIKGFNSELIETDDGQVAVLRVSEHRPAAVLSLSEVEPNIRQMLSVELAAELNAETTDSLMQAMAANPKQSAVKLKRLATAHQSSFETVEKLRRDDASVPPVFVTQAFQMPLPNVDDFSLSTVALSDGSHALIRLHHNDSDAENTKVDQAEWIAQQTGYGQRELNAIAKALRETGDVQIFSDSL
jgi:peptidyl-prolyl cis-trans isomerase D|tara:strand:- start:2314 stop:4278 length:1965 start_codon:yes stop_codon:yes gene_type:complete